MLNRFSIEVFATKIMKRAAVAEYIPDDTDTGQKNMSAIHEDFKDLADLLGYRVEKKEQQK